MPATLSLKELGLTFSCLSASEPDSTAQAFIAANFSQNEILSVKSTMQEQIEENRSFQDEQDQDGFRGLAPHLAVFGSPCNPFSRQRVKRFQDGAQKHKMFETTFLDLRQWLEEFNPPTAVMEQVLGFDMRIQSDDARTPLSMFLGSSRANNDRWGLVAAG